MNALSIHMYRLEQLTHKLLNSKHVAEPQNAENGRDMSTMK